MGVVPTQPVGRVLVCAAQRGIVLGGVVMEIMLIDFAICLITTIAVMCIAMCYVHIKLGRDKA